MVKKIIIIIGSLLLFSRCYTEKVYTTEYYYLNESGVEIEIREYINDILKESNKLYFGEQLTKVISNMGNTGPFRSILQLEIIYNHDKKRVFHWDDYNIAESPYNIYEYSEISTNKKRTRKFEFIFTPEMYENADPIEP